MSKDAGSAKQRTLVPLKITGQLHAAWRDESGEIVGEEIVGQVTFYAPDFASVAEKIAEAWPQAVATFTAS